MVPALGSENFRQAAGWLIRGQGLHCGGRQLPLETHTPGGSGSPCSFPSHRGWGGGALLPLLGPDWSLVGAGFPFPAGLTPSAHPFPRKPTIR